MAPQGWHITTYGELITLKRKVSNYSNVLKEIGQGLGTITSGFSTLLAGYSEPHGNFTVLGDYTGFWSSTKRFIDETHFDVKEAWHVYLWGNYNSINSSITTKDYGFSVRCLKNF